MCKPQLSSAAPYVPLDTIVDSGRVLRRPLGEWAGQLVTVLRSCMDATPGLDTTYRASAALNNAALIFAHAGHAHIAEEICQTQLDWIAGLRGVLPGAELAVLAMQPWVNLGRLCRRARDYERALRYFSGLRGCRIGATVKFGSWDAPVSSNFCEAAEPIYVYESMRTFLQADDLDCALAFAHALGEPGLRTTLMLKTELLIHIHLKRREPGEMLSLTKAMPWPEDYFGVLAKYFYFAIALGAIGQRQSCAHALERIRPQLFAYVERQDVDSRNIRLVLEACRLAAHLGLDDLLASMLSVGCSLVLRAADVPFAFAILHLAKLHGCQAALEELASLEELTSRSGYPAPACKSPSQAIATELAELRSAISQLVCVPAHA
jgi:hypothetical protein